MPPLSKRPVAHFPLIIGIIAVLLIVELALEIRAYYRGYLPLFFSLGRTELVSEYPFRSPKVDQQKPDGELRIWIAAASHADDGYLPLTSIFPSQICENFIAQNTKCGVINGSKAGADIAQNLAMMRTYANQYQPDFAVLYHGSIEIQRLSKKAFAVQPVNTDASEPSLFQRAMSEPKRLLENTTLYEHAMQQIRTRLMAAKQLHDALPEQRIEEFKASVWSFINEAKIQNIKPVLTTFSARHSIHHLQEFDDDLFRSQLRYNPYLSKRGWLSTIDAFNQVLKDVSLEAQVPLIDLAPVMTDNPDYFRDFSHFTPEGHRVMGREIFDALKQMQEKERAS